MSTADPPRYSPKVFNVSTEEEAREIILQGAAAGDSDERWKRETPWFGGLIRESLGLLPESRVLDFGCGVGRLSKWLIEQVGCRVVGVDISESMRKFAVDHVASPKFTAVSYEAFSTDPACGEGFDAAYAVYVLQHVERPDLDIPAIARGLRSGGRFLLVNSKIRWVPTTQGWAQDQFDVFAIAASNFIGLNGYVFPKELAVLDDLDKQTVINLYRRP